MVFFCSALTNIKISQSDSFLRWHPDCLKLERDALKKNLNYFFYSPPKVPSERNRKTCQENLQ